MPDLDARIDAELRSEYERLEAEAPPAWLLDFDPKFKRSRDRRLSAFAGIAGVAVIAAGIATFGIELGRHSRPAAPTTHSSAAATPTVSTSAFPTTSRVVIPVIRGSGSTELPIVISNGRLLYVAFECAGDGQLQIRAKSVDVLAPAQPAVTVLQCSSSTTSQRTYVAATPGTGTPLTLTIVAKQSTRWALAAAEGDVSANFPSLSDVVPENEVSTILLWDTYGSGVASLPTFTPAAPSWIQFACLGSGPISIQSSTGTALFTSQSCNSPGLIGLTVPADEVRGRALALSVHAGSSTTWELRIVQKGNAAMPQPFQTVPGKPSPGSVRTGVLIPLTHGEGAATLPTFTLTTPYYEIELSCSGPGSVTIVGPPGSTQSSVCDDRGTSGGSVQGATPGIPISLKLTADPDTSWDIEIFGVSQLGPQP